MGSGGPLPVHTLLAIGPKDSQDFGNGGCDSWGVLVPCGPQGP